MPDPAPDCPSCARQRELTHALQTRYAKRDRHSAEDAEIRADLVEQSVAHWRGRALRAEYYWAWAERELGLAKYALAHDGPLAVECLEALAAAHKTGTQGTRRTPDMESGGKARKVA